MSSDEALEIIITSPQYRELIEAIEEAKKSLSPDAWQEISSTLINEVEKFVAWGLVELSEEGAGKTFQT